MLNSYFDNIYILNLYSRPDRLKLIKKRLTFVDIKYEIFNAIDGTMLNYIWKYLKLPNAFFANSNYLACALSHLSIYKDAIEKDYKRILIIEDDCRIHRNINEIFNKQVKNIPEWNELLYLGYIPLTDDCAMWSYDILLDKYINNSTFIAKNLWGLYSYGITNTLMKEVLETYNNNFSMELDRYFVNYIQPRNLSYGLSPQLFCAENGYSDNSKKNEINMLDRSINAYFSKHSDFI